MVVPPSKAEILKKYESLVAAIQEQYDDGLITGEERHEAGLKENVIIGKLIPAATGLKRYRSIEIEPAEPLPRGMDDVGLLEGDGLAAELGLSHLAKGPEALVLVAPHEEVEELAVLLELADTHGWRDALSSVRRL